MAFRRWIWCRDLVTNHHFDVDERQLARLVRANAVEPVEGYPVNEGQNVRPRPPKHAVNHTAKPGGDEPAPVPPAQVATDTPGTPATVTAPPRRGTRTATAAPTATTTEGVE